MKPHVSLDFPFWNDFRTCFKVQMKCFFFITELERVAKLRKIAVYCFLISLQSYEGLKISDQKVPEKAVEINQNQ